ncbi:MAG: AAA family ATPase [Candidatus Sericytochromatia bacterium]
MESIRIQNLRCLRDTGEIPIKAINLLIGKNSSGKSSFLRTFPLLRQSIEVKTRSPILWYGDYVDFGDFNTAITKGTDSIIFEFKIMLTNNYVRFYRLLPNNLFVYIKISLKCQSENNVYINNLSIRFNDQYISVNLSHDGELTEFVINNEDYTEKSSNIQAIFLYGLLPEFLFVSDKLDEKKLFSRKNNPILLKEIISFIKKNTKSNLSDEKIRLIINDISLGNLEYILNTIQQSSSIKSKSWYNIVKKWSIENKDFKKLNNLLLCYRFPELLEVINTTLTSFSKDICYIAPLRVTAERYYRRQNLGVSEVDFQGRNLPMFIDNMTSSSKKRFQEWVSRSFGFYPDTSSSEGHISLRLFDSKTNEGFNIADKGFGFSQLLPIITQLWSIINNKQYINQNFSKIVLTIEQPELHLHPALQAKLIDCFIEAIELAKTKQIDLRIIVETHSPTLVNRLGHMIIKNKITEEEVSILLFEKFNLNDNDIKIVNFNHEGFLEDWPSGFFDPEED